MLKGRKLPSLYQILISVPLLPEQIFNTCSSVINIFLSQQFTQSLKSGYWETKVSQFVSKYVHEDNIGALRGKLKHQYENDWLIQEF
jgi:E3 ubiquitin-protein ligase DOA10